MFAIQQNRNTLALCATTLMSLGLVLGLAWMLVPPAQSASNCGDLRARMTRLPASGPAYRELSQEYWSTCLAWAQEASADEYCPAPGCLENPIELAPFKDSPTAPSR